MLIEAKVDKFDNAVIVADRNYSVCDLILPKREAPSTNMNKELYLKAKKEYDDYIKYCKGVRSNFLNTYRGRPYKLVLRELL